MDYFSRSTCGYTGSDEITLVFPALLSSDQINRKEVESIDTSAFQNHALPSSSSSSSFESIKSCLHKPSPITALATETLSPTTNTLISTTATAQVVNSSIKGNDKVFDEKGDEDNDSVMSDASDSNGRRDRSQMHNSVDSTLPFGGRVQKMVSLAAALCSVKFNYFLAQQTFDQAKEAKLLAKVKSALAFFDARAFNLPSDIELANNLIWRSRIDCTRNSKTLLGSIHFKQHEIDNKPADVVVRMLKQKKNINWEDFPSEYKFGSFIKREQYLKEGFNPITKQAVIAQRRRLVSKSFIVPADPRSVAQLLLAPLWTEGLINTIFQANQSDTHDNISEEGQIVEKIIKKTSDN